MDSFYSQVVAIGALAAISVAGFHGVARSDDAATDDEIERWFGEESPEPVQVGKGEITFLARPSESRTLQVQNTLTITGSSLSTGWVELEQCYHDLDPVPEAEVIYQYKSMRQLRIQSLSRIENAFVQGQSVQLSNVEQDATLCIRAEVRILYAGPDGTYTLYNGPFHRKFLDGYFPMHIMLEVRYPYDLLRFVDSKPKPQPGFNLQQSRGRLAVDTWFAGTLNIEVHFIESKQAEKSDG